MKLIAPKSDYIDSRFYPIISSGKKEITSKTKTIWIQNWNKFLFKYDSKHHVLYTYISQKNGNAIVFVERHIKFNRVKDFKRKIIEKLLKNFKH